jgi:hypothetical protein
MQFGRWTPSWYSIGQRYVLPATALPCWSLLWIASCRSTWGVQRRPNVGDGPPSTAPRGSLRRHRSAIEAVQESEAGRSPNGDHRARVTRPSAAGPSVFVPRVKRTTYLPTNRVLSAIGRRHHGPGQVRCTKMLPSTRTSIFVRRKHSSASTGRHTIGSFSLNDVLSTMGIPVISRKLSSTRQ